MLPPPLCQAPACTCCLRWVLQPALCSGHGAAYGVRFLLLSPYSILGGRTCVPRLLIPFPSAVTRVPRWLLPLLCLHVPLTLCFCQLPRVTVPLHHRHHSPHYTPTTTWTPLPLLHNNCRCPAVPVFYAFELAHPRFARPPGGVSPHSRTTGHWLDTQRLDTLRLAWPWFRGWPQQRGQAIDSGLSYSLDGIKIDLPHHLHHPLFP